MARRVRTDLLRHSYKKAGTKTGLSGKGIAKARALGRKTPKAFKVKGYWSESPRAQATLGFSLGAFRAIGGKTYPKAYYSKREKKTYPKIKERKEIGLESLRDAATFEKMLKDAGSEEILLRKWLDGKISTKVLDKPETVADKIIKRRIALGQRVAKKGGKGILLRNISHSWIIEAVFERLTGKRYDKLRHTTMARPTEGLVFVHYKNSRLSLKYRGKTFDVTKKFNQIIRKKAAA